MTDATTCVVKRQGLRVASTKTARRHARAGRTYQKVQLTREDPAAGVG